MARWANNVGQFKSPALIRPDSSMATTSEEKGGLLQATHLPAERSQADIKPPALTQYEAQLWPSLTRQEVEQTIWQAKDTAPGNDKISAAAIRKTWPFIGDPVYKIFAMCLKEGWHPTPFRKAVLCALEKPGKQDKSHPQSYRLIALLSVLGKGFERVIACRLAWEAIERQILPPGYFGTLPLRSATDLATLLTDDIQSAFSSGQVLLTVTFDVQGGFNTVLPNRLTSRLMQQQWPRNLINWVQSFVTKRSASIRLNCKTGVPTA